MICELHLNKSFKKMIILDRNLDLHKNMETLEKVNMWVNIIFFLFKIFLKYNYLKQK